MDAKRTDNMIPMSRYKSLRRAVMTILIIAACALTGIAREYLELVGDADKAIAESRWDDAIELLDRAMRENPSNDMNVLLLSNTGMLNYYAGRDSAALARLDMAHRMAPASVTVLCNRARVHTSMGDLERALRDYDTATALDSTAIEPYYYRGMILLAVNDTLAARDMQTLGRLAPDNLMTHRALALYDSECGRWQEALPHYNVLIDNEPTAVNYADRAVCRLKTGDYTGASNDISLGIEADPECADLYVARALYEQLCYRHDTAMDNVRRAIDLGASQARIKALLGL